MRDRFYGTYQSILFKRCYYEENQRRSERLLFIARFGCAVISILSVLAWSISKSLPTLWACLIALAQIAQSMVDFLPWARQISASHYLLPELNELLTDMDEQWLKLEYIGSSKEDVLSAIAAFERRFYSIEEKYTTGVWFPVVKRVLKNADRATENYLVMRCYLTKREDDADDRRP